MTPVHTDCTHVSNVVLKFPSSQLLKFCALCVHPVSVLQASRVHSFWSLQSFGINGVHEPLLQYSSTVHASPSLQGSASCIAVKLQLPFIGLHCFSKHSVLSEGSHVLIVVTSTLHV